MKTFKLWIVGIAVLSLAACSQSDGPKQQVGTLLGAAAGAVAGAQFGSGRGALAATAVGTLLGALAGSEIGKSLDRADMTYLQTDPAESARNHTVRILLNLDEPGFGKLGSGYSATHIPECGRHLLP